MAVPGYGKAGYEHENEWLLLGWPILLQVSIVGWLRWTLLSLLPLGNHPWEASLTY